LALVCALDEVLRLVVERRLLAVERRLLAVERRVVPVVDLRVVPLVDLRVVVRLAAGLRSPGLLVVAMVSLAPLDQDIRCRGRPCLVSIEHMFVPQSI
jgi:hypothetical protein